MKKIDKENSKGFEGFIVIITLSNKGGLRNEEKINFDVVNGCDDLFINGVWR